MTNIICIAYKEFMLLNYWEDRSNRKRLLYSNIYS